MLNDEDVVRLRHMLEAAQKAVLFTKDCTAQSLHTDEKLALAVIRLLEVLGEAANSVSDECQDAYPEIPWQQVAATRNRLIHGYFDVDLNIVWQIVSTDLPKLIEQLRRILHR